MKIRFPFLVLLILIPFLLSAQRHQKTKTVDSVRWDVPEIGEKAASFMNVLEREVLWEINKARSNPQQYARLYIAPMLSQFEGNLYVPERLQTQEGQKAVEECVHQLETTGKMNLLLSDKELYKTAERHTSLQSPTNQTGHTSPNGETFEYRLRKLRYSELAECISYGSETARKIVIQLLIDDGVPSRGHRKTLLNPTLKVAGIAVGSHKVFKAMCTLDFGGTLLSGAR